MDAAFAVDAADGQALAACNGAAAARRAGADFDQLVALWQSLRGALQEIEHSIKTVSGEVELGLAHWLVLLRLGRSSPMMQSELRQLTGLDSGFLSRLLDELDARQLVRRARSSVDRRQVELRVSGAGRAAMRSMLSRAGTSRLLDRRQLLAAAPFAPAPAAAGAVEQAS